MSEKRKHAGRGEAQRWLQQVAQMEPTGECVFYPWAGARTRTARRRAMTTNRRTGKNDYAYRIVWEMHHAQPFPAGLEARHSCNNGHLSCCAWWHIAVGTHEENVADMIRDKTVATGSRIGNSVLREEQILPICQLIEEGQKFTTIARLYGVHPVTIQNIWSGRCWYHISGRPRTRH